VPTIKNHWDSVALDIIEEATDPRRYSDVAAIVMSEGLAHVCLITPTTTIVRARLDMSVPR
jgi:protein pelota